MPVGAVGHVYYGPNEAAGAATEKKQGTAAARGAETGATRQIRHGSSFDRSDAPPPADSGYAAREGQRARRRSPKVVAQAKENTQAHDKNATAKKFSDGSETVKAGVAKLQGFIGRFQSFNQEFINKQVDALATELNFKDDVKKDPGKLQDTIFDRIIQVEDELKKLGVDTDFGDRLNRRSAEIQNFIKDLDVVADKEKIAMLQELRSLTQLQCLTLEAEVITYTNESKIDYVITNLKLLIGANFVTPLDKLPEKIEAHIAKLEKQGAGPRVIAHWKVLHEAVALKRLINMPPKKAHEAAMDELNNLEEKFQKSLKRGDTAAAKTLIDDISRQARIVNSITMDLTAGIKSGSEAGSSHRTYDDALRNACKDLLDMLANYTGEERATLMTSVNNKLQPDPRWE